MNCYIEFENGDIFWACSEVIEIDASSLNVFMSSKGTFYSFPIKEKIKILEVDGKRVYPKKTAKEGSSLVYTYDELYKLADELDTENMELRIQVSGLKDANEYLKQENELLKAENEEAKHALWIMEVIGGKK